MESIDQIPPLRARIADWRRAGNRIALVPTMGNLHLGHLHLIREAHRLSDRVVVSIFVNPLQFGPSEDFAAYPRTLARDRQHLEAEGVSLLFAPDAAILYPRGQADQTRVQVPGLSEILCGASRPGHFVGVATVVCKLFNLVQPDLAVFGEKDFQQLLILRRMTEDLNLPIAIHGVATVRESDGLAMSSRNAYLSPEERARAPGLYRTLVGTADHLKGGLERTQAERWGLRALKEAGFKPDYLQIRRRADLGIPDPEDRHLVILAAAYLGRARLIDHLPVDL